MILTTERVRELLDHDPQTKTFTWRVSLANRIRPGMVTGKQHGVGIKGWMFTTKDLIALHTGAVSSLHGRPHRNGERQRMLNNEPKITPEAFDQHVSGAGPKGFEPPARKPEKRIALRSKPEKQSIVRAPQVRKHQWPKSLEPLAQEKPLSPPKRPRLKLKEPTSAIVAHLRKLGVPEPNIAKHIASRTLAQQMKPRMNYTDQTEEHEHGRT